MSFAELYGSKICAALDRQHPRDIFDILAVYRLDPDIVAAAVSFAPDGARRAVDRIRRIEKRYRETIKDEVNPTATGAELLEVDPIEAAEILSG